MITKEHLERFAKVWEVTTSQLLLINKEYIHHFNSSTDFAAHAAKECISRNTRVAPILKITPMWLVAWNKEFGYSLNVKYMRVYAAESQEAGPAAGQLDGPVLLKSLLSWIAPAPAPKKRKSNAIEE